MSIKVGIVGKTGLFRGESELSIKNGTVDKSRDCGYESGLSIKGIVDENGNC